MLLLDAGVMYRITCASRAVPVNADRLANRCRVRLMYRIIGHYPVVAPAGRCPGKQDNS